MQGNTEQNHLWGRHNAPFSGSHPAYLTADDWFSAPGDLDDFIFYDSLSGSYGDPDDYQPHSSQK